MSNEYIKDDDFDLPGFHDAFDEIQKLYEASDDPDLKEVAKLALNAYSQQMKDIMLMEPKYRSRALEVANQYLNVAKDALSKNEDIQLKKEKQEAETAKKQKESNDENGEIDRNELLLELSKELGARH